VVERYLVDLWEEGGHTVARPFRRMAWREALERYGIDKPDLRFGLELQDFTAHVGSDAAPFVAEAKSSGGRLRGIVVPGGASLSRKDLDALTAVAKDAKAGGLIWAKRSGSGWEGQGVKALGSALLEQQGGSEGDLLLAVTGKDEVTGPALHAIRQDLIRRLKPKPVSAHAFAWIVDFPLFELDPESGQYVPAHHPFTAPHPEDLGRLESDPGHCRALHYDAVYNGNELGSGSIRITDTAIQRTIFRLLGLSEDEIRRRFGFLLDGLAAGAPPHGGFALGFDRIAMLLANGTSLRDVIAFPKTTAARALFEGAPTQVDARDLAALHLDVRRET
jgi:aspartyl-tRNA synthetase